MANIDKNIDNNEIGEENNKSSIKNVKEKVKKLSWWAKLFLFCFFSFIFLVVSLLIAINIPSVKDKLAKEAINMLNSEFKTTFSAENVEINFLGDVVINGVSAKDHHDFEFLKAKKLTAHSDWFAIAFNSRDLKFQKISLEEPDLKVITYKGEEQDNFTKYIEKFDTPKDPTKPPAKFTTRIEIINGKVSIVNKNLGEDGNWLKAENFNAYVSDLKTNGPNVTLKLNKFSFITERWGKKHKLEALSGDVTVTNEKLELKDLIFHTDHSLLQGDLVFNLDKKTGWKDFNNKVVWDMNLKRGSYLHGYDISYFVKNWDNYQKYQLFGKMDGTLNDFVLKNFLIKVKDNEIQTSEIRLAKLMEGNFNIKSNQISAAFTYKGLRESLPTFIAKKMGGVADDFGRIKYNGFADLNKDRVAAKGNLITGIGQAQIDNFVLRNYSSKMPEYSGNLTLKDLNTTILTKNRQVGLVSGKFNVQGKGFDINTLSLNTKSQISKIELMGKTLNNISLDGELAQKQFKGIININDTQARGVVNGKIDFSKPRLSADVDAKIDHLNLAYFGASGSGTNTFRGDVKGKVSMTNINDLDLDATINNVVLGGNKPVSIPNGAVKVAMEGGNRVIEVDMPDAVKGRILGKFNLSNLGGIFQELSNRLLVGNKVKKYYKNEDFTMDVEVHQKLVDYFLPNAYIPQGARITGQFNGNSNELVLNVDAPSFKYVMEKEEEVSRVDKLLAQTNPEYVVRQGVKKDSVLVKNAKININTADFQKYWALNVGRVEYQKSLLKDINITAQNEDNKKLNISANLHVGTLEKEEKNQMTPYAANIEQFINEQGDYVVKFDPTNLKISNYLWMVDTSPELDHSIVYRKKNQDFQIKNLRLYSDESEILVNGIFKNAKDFDISAEVKQMALAKVWKTIHQDSNIDIQGIANGSIKINMNQHRLEPLIDIKVDNISVNDSRIGNLVVSAESSDTENIYDVKAKISSGGFFDSDNLVLEGKIDNNTASPTLDLSASLKDLNIAFVQAFVKDIFSNFRGTASGDIKIDGTLKDINYGGDIAMKGFGLKLNFSGVDYTFDDTVVTLSNGNLLFNLVGVKDSRKNSKGTISIGRLSLSDLSNIGADLLIRADNLMLLNTTQSDFDTFWGMIYAKGDIFVGYDSKGLKIDATADVLDNSVFTLNSASASSVDKFKMLRFITVSKSGEIQLAEKNKNRLNMEINLDITANKNSMVNVLLGDEVGNISVSGETKNMKFSMDKTGNINMFGGYFVDSGNYISKAILEKTFQIQRGSNIQWSGDVLNPDLNITANYYSLVSNASEYLNVASLPTINVQLQTKITNKMKEPKITPSINAPDVSSQIREVMAYKLSTEEEKVLQFASILALGNFNVSNTNGYSALGSGVNAFLKQLSSAFNSISNDFQLDMDFIKGSTSANTGDRANTRLNINVSPRWKIKTGIGVPLSKTSTTQNNYLSGEGIVEYDWSKIIDGSRVFRIYSKPSNVGLVMGSNAGANQSYGVGVVVSYSFNRFFPSKKKKDEKESPKKDTIVIDSAKSH